MLVRIIALSLVAASSSAFAADDLSDIFGGGVFKGKKLEKAIAKADQHPLGSADNPVRVNMPRGQRSYLSRLRCEDGNMPQFQRGGSTGEGPFGAIVDVYDVDCGGAAPGKVAVYLDMYHPDHVEQRTVPGFTIVAP
jgi:hypothetical protein